MRKYMKRFQKVGRTGALAALTLSLSACGVLKTPDTGLSARDWRDDVIYFAMTDRFANGNTANDNGPNRNAGDRADKTNPLAWHGGDFAGLKAKIEEGYFKRMGFTAIWISPVVLQVPAIAGPTTGPNTGKLFAGYHGYWAEDFFKVDPHFGTLAEYKALIQSAHRNNIKIIQDVVVNHAGYGSTLLNQHPDWFRTSPECYAPGVTTEQDCTLSGLPDFRQELPEVTKYLNDFVTYWRSETGIDGLRIDTMKHVPDSYWRQFFAAGGAGTPLANALVEATTAQPDLNYAISFPDGTYTMFVPAGAQTLRATANGHQAAERQATSPGTGADIDLAPVAAVPKYTIDGSLGDWTAPKVSVQSPKEGVFGANNNWLTLQADSDGNYLYLAYTYRVENNGAILYLDTKSGGAAQADTFEAWKRAATFSGGMGGVDAFVARYNDQSPQLRLVTSDTATPEVSASRYTVATSGDLPAQTVELAIPWSALGLSGAPAGGVNVVGGIFGGDGYGAGDIIPDAGSTPPGANTIGAEADQRRATFTAPIHVK